MRLASRTSRWLRILADRHDTTVAAVIRDLRTAPALAREVVHVLDRLALDEARALFEGKTPKPLPPDADWLTRHHYNEIKAVRDEKARLAQEQVWAQLMARQEAAKAK
jgi:hypothetical protein